MKQTFLLILSLLLLSTAAITANEQYYFRPISPVGGLGYDGIRSICQDSEGYIWVLQSEALFRYDGHTFKNLNRSIRPTDNTLPIYFRSIITGRDGKLLLTTSAGGFSYNVETETFEEVFPSSVNPVAEDYSIYLPDLVDAGFDPNVPIRCVAFDKEGNRWIGTQRGLWIQEKETGLLRQYVSDGQNGLRNNSIWTIFRDKDNNMWLGSFSGQLNMVASDGNNPMQKLSPSGNQQQPVSAIIKDESSNMLYIGTEGGGIYAIQMPDGNIVQHITSEEKILSYDNIKSLQLQGNKLWIGMYLGGLDCFDLATREVTHFKAGQPHAELLSNQVSKLLLSKDGSQMWIAYQCEGNTLTTLDMKHKQFIHHQISSKEAEYEHRRIVDMVEQNDSILWVLTAVDLYCYDYQADSLRYHIHPLLNQQALQMRTLLYDSTRRALWIGTQSHGLVLYDLATRHLQQKVQVPSVYAIQNDLQGRMWLSSSNGLYCYHPEDNRCVEYDMTDGMQSPVFHPLACHLDRSGTLYMGGAEGLNCINPENFSINYVAPNVRISEMYINGKPLDDSTRIYHLRQLAQWQLQLNHKENNLSLLLSCDNYVHPEKNTYRYRLTERGLITSKKGPWIETDAEHRMVVLSQLQAGRYQLELQAANNDGERGCVRVLSITVKPVFWASAWALCLYLLIIAGLLLYVIHTIIMQNKLRNEVYLANEMRRQEEQTNRAKVRFFTDVDKELRKPLEELKNNLTPTQQPLVDEMVATMSSYADRYCIDTSQEWKERNVETGLNKFRSLVEERMISGKIDIDLLAQEMGMSRRKLFNFVKENTGKSIIEWIRSYRLQTALKLMMEQGVSMREAMDKVGIESQSYFIKSFKEEYGDTPNGFIAKMSNGNANQSSIVS